MHSNESNNVDRTCQDQGQDNACTKCQRRRICQHIAQAMDTLETEPLSVVNLRLCRTRKFLRKRLDDLGFRFPINPRYCLFSQLDANHARRILFRAKDLCLEWEELNHKEGKKAKLNEVV